jgi:hypothetical protein
MISTPSASLGVMICRLGVVVDAVAGIDQLAVDLPATVALARPAPMDCGYILHADGVVELADAAVRKGDVDHGIGCSGRTCNCYCIAGIKHKGRRSALFPRGWLRVVRFSRQRFASW